MGIKAESKHLAQMLTLCAPMNRTDLRGTEVECKISTGGTYALQHLRKVKRQTQFSSLQL